MIEHLEDVVEKQPKPRGLQGSSAVVLVYLRFFLVLQWDVLVAQETQRKVMLQTLSLCTLKYIYDMVCMPIYTFWTFCFQVEKTIFFCFS